MLMTIKHILIFLPMAIVIATSTLGSWRADSNDLPKNGGLLSHGGTPTSDPFFLGFSIVNHSAIGDS